MKGTSLGTFCKVFLQLNLWFHMFQTIHSLKQQQLLLLVQQQEQCIHSRALCFKTFFGNQCSLWVFLMCSQFHFISRWCSSHSFGISFSGIKLTPISILLYTTSTYTFIWELFSSFTGSFCLLDFCKDSFLVSPRHFFQLLVYTWIMIYTITTGL